MKAMRLWLFEGEPPCVQPYQNISKPLTICHQMVIDSAAIVKKIMHLRIETYAYLHKNISPEF
jgi:hypothetical protein